MPCNQKNTVGRDTPETAPKDTVRKPRNGKHEPRKTADSSTENATTFSEIETLFHSMPLTKYEIPDGLAAEWLQTAVADYELNIGVDLQYDPVVREFARKLPSAVRLTLARMMYRSFLQRELSRVMVLNGIYGKDVQLTGQDATKRVVKQELDDQTALVEVMLHRQKTSAYG